MNFTASFLGYQNKNILDESGIEIPTIKTSKAKTNFYYKTPSMVVDKLHTQKKFNEPIVERITYKELYKLGFCIVSQQATSETRFRRMQKTILKLCQKNNIPASGRIIDMPAEHHAEIDVSNKLVRLVGKNAGYNGYSEWQSS